MDGSEKVPKTELSEKCEISGFGEHFPGLRLKIVQCHDIRVLDKIFVLGRYFLFYVSKMCVFN